MTLTLLRGVPESGKSTQLISALREASDSGQPVVTFSCSDFPRPASIRRQLEAGLFGSRKPGCHFRLDHYVRTEDVGPILRTVPPGTLVGIDDAYQFGANVVPGWLDALDRGVHLLIAAPSQSQVNLVKPRDPTEVNLRIPCQSCQREDASTIVIDARDNLTRSICQSCMAIQTIDAQSELVRLLRDARPESGQDALSFPVELSVLDTWRVWREDSEAQASLMHTLAMGVLDESRGESPTFLDLGSGTGYFTSYFAARGFIAKGVDDDPMLIEASRLLESYVRRPHRGGVFVIYELADISTYLEAATSEQFDVVSSQLDVEQTTTYVLALAARTKRLMILELGHEIAAESDAASGTAALVQRALLASGFGDVRVFDKALTGLQRDLIAGTRTS